MSSRNTSILGPLQARGISIDEYPRLAVETDDTGRFTRSTNAATNANVPLILGGGIYVVSSTWNIPSNLVVIGAGRKNTFIQGNFAGYLAKINYLNVTLFGMTFQSGVTTQANVKASGLDMTATPHDWELHDVGFVNLNQAFYATGAWNGWVDGVYVMDCGTATQYAVSLTHDANGNQTNDVTYNAFHVEWSGNGWSGKGLYISDLDHAFNGLHIEHCLVADAFTSDAQGVVINGLYCEDETGSGNNVLTFNKGGTVNGGYINSHVAANARLTFNGAYFGVNPPSIAYMTLNNCTPADNRFVVDVQSLHVHNWPIITLGENEVVDIPTTSGSFEEWGIGYTSVGQQDYYGGSHSIQVVNTAGDFLTGTRSLEVSVNGTNPNGAIYFNIPSDLAGEELYGWAVVKVPAGQTIQCSYGFGAYDFSNGANELEVSSAITNGDWQLIIVGPFVPVGDYVTFNINSTGGGTAPSGDNFFIDSFGVCKHGVRYDVITRRNISLTQYRKGTAYPTVGTWSVGDYFVNTAPSVQGAAGSQYIIKGWECVTAGTPGTWVQDRALTGS